MDVAGAAEAFIDRCHAQARELKRFCSKKIEEAEANGDSSVNVEISKRVIYHTDLTDDFWQELTAAGYSVEVIGISQIRCVKISW